MHINENHLQNYKSYSKKKLTNKKNPKTCLTDHFWKREKKRQREREIGEGRERERDRRGQRERERRFWQREREERRKIKWGRKVGKKASS